MNIFFIYKMKIIVLLLLISFSLSEDCLKFDVNSFDDCKDLEPTFAGEGCCFYHEKKKTLNIATKMCMSMTRDAYDLRLISYENAKSEYEEFELVCPEEFLNPINTNEEEIDAVDDDDSNSIFIKFKRIFLLFFLFL